jgi:hypothetical protein
MVSAVALSALETDLPIGQVIFDINGEYSNANNQDEGSSIADVFGDNTIRYRASFAPGFRDVRVNFYESLDMGRQFIANNLRDEGGSMSEDLQTFISLDFEEPDPADFSAKTRWQRRVAIYQCILKAAGYPHASSFKIEFSVGKPILKELYSAYAPIQKEYPSATSDDECIQAAIKFFSLSPAAASGVYRASPEDAVTFWSTIRDVEKAKGGPADDKGLRDGKKKWLSIQEYALLCVLVGKSSKNDGPIRAANAIRNAAIQFHSATGSANVAEDIYGLLKEGRIVIVDLSVGPPSVRETMAERIARHVFDKSSRIFTEGGTPPRVVIYVEEAHNLIGKNSDLNTTWPRVAKEGAKYGISLVYATQEPSSIHPNILSNTENFFVTHLNNDNEIKGLARYYDFEDFSESLKRCQDVGFARIKTLSSNFTTPTQILLFEPAKVLTRYKKAKESGTGWFKPLAMET